MKRYLARLTRQKPEIKDTKDHARLIRWTHNCIKELMGISDQFKRSIKFVIIYLSTILAPVLEHSLIRSKNINHSRYNQAIIILEPSVI
jgi:hypothetical protein